MTTQQFESWSQPEGTSLQDWLNTRIARLKHVNMILMP